MTVSPLRSLLIAAALAASPAYAVTYSTDYSDLWFKPDESGWGVNLIQQSNVIVATLFVYNQNSAAHWYIASDLEPATPGSQTVFTGALYETFGPWFGSGSFPSSAVGYTQVGSMTLTFTDDSHATLDYFVNGVHVTKPITRQTWRNDSLTGSYLGGLTAQGTNCGGTFNGTPVTNGPILVWESLTVQHSGSAAAMTAQFTSNQGQASQCSFNGTYTQNGHIGSITGNWSCTLGSAAYNQGTFTVSGIQSSPTGFSGFFTGRDQYCTYSGQFGGVKDVM